jgi:crotonobetainyl-CoA:carnitine CoA-transferase CaiB-like acyl-CoA transferase
MEPVMEGVKVIEVGEWVFAPAAGAVLADWGADVIKVEHPQRGDSMRGIMDVIASTGVDTGDFNYLIEQSNRGKRSIGLDLASPRGREVFLDLVAGADVLITSLLEPSRRRLGVAYEDLAELNPRLIYARGHGQGQRGPDADSGGVDAVSFWARGGVGSALTRPGEPLVAQRQAIGDLTAAMFLAGGVAAALFRRSVTGKGGLVDVSLFNSATWILAPDILSGHLTGSIPVMSPRDAGAPLNPLTGQYSTEDDRIIILGMLQSDGYWPGFCRALGLERLIDDTACDTFKKREHNETLYATIRDTFRSAPLDHWRDRLTDNGCVWTPVQSPLDVPEDPQAIANGYLPAHPSVPQAILAASPVQFNNGMVEIDRGAPEMGEHTEEILLELGLDWDAIAKLKSDSIVT